MEQPGFEQPAPGQERADRGASHGNTLIATLRVLRRKFRTRDAWGCQAGRRASSA